MCMTNKDIGAGHEGPRVVREVMTEKETLASVQVPGRTEVQVRVLSSREHREATEHFD